MQDVSTLKQYKGSDDDMSECTNESQDDLESEGSTEPAEKEWNIEELPNDTNNTILVNTPTSNSDEAINAHEEVEDNFDDIPHKYMLPAYYCVIT